jgi:hypothetical protein
MNNRRSIMAVSTIALATGGLAACSLFKEEVRALSAKDCTGPGLCEVQVVVNNCVPTTNDPIIVKKAGGAIQIRWLAPSGYVFTAEGIKFDSSPVIDPKPGIQQGGERWMVVDTPNGQPIRSKYRIQVKSTSSLGTICTGPDPFIANE